MKSVIYIMGVILLVSTFMVSCQKESNAVNIESVWTNQVDTVPHTITTRKIGSWIRLHGAGFDGVTKVLCNQMSVNINPNYATETDIIFQIPSTLTVPGDSTITVVTDHGSYTYKPFVFVP